MEKPSIDLSFLPEPFKSMANNLDTQAIQKFLSMYDPATLSSMMSSYLAMFKNSLNEEQINSIKKMMEQLFKESTQKK